MILIVLLTACSDAPVDPPPFGMNADLLADGVTSSSMAMVTADGERPIGTAHQGVERGEEDTSIVDVTTALNTTRHWISRANGHLVQVLVEVGGGNRFEQHLLCG